MIKNLKDLKESLHEKYPTLFLFHGVIKSKNYKSIRNYNNKHITLKKFEKYIKYLKLNGSPIDLDEYLTNFKKKKNLSKKKPFIITFDDGFFNNLKYALPILQKYNMPHIIYLTTNYVDKNLISWIDRIDIAIDKTKKKKIYSNILKQQFKLNSFREKKNFLEFIRSYAKSNKGIDLNTLADELITDLKLKSPLFSNNILDKKLNWKEIKMMSKNKLTKLGGHSHNHNILGHLDSKDWKKEIVNSIDLIKKKTGITISHYSYPEGFKTSYNKYIINFLKKKNIKTAVTTNDKINFNHVNEYKLNRKFVV